MKTPKGVTIKNEEDIKKLRISCHRVAEILRVLAKEVKPGVSTGYLDDIAYKMIKEYGDEPAFLNYKPYGADYPYPATVCISVNDEVVHGIPSYENILKDGDLVDLDCGIIHEGMYSDHAITVACGNITDEEKELIEITKKSLKEGIKKAVAGNKVQDISRAIENSIPKKYGIVKGLSGHGVGYGVHEEPYVPNYDDGVKGPILKPGMVLAIEPMINMGTDEVEICADGYTIVTADGRKSCHFEHTILITDKGPEILTV